MSDIEFNKIEKKSVTLSNGWRMHRWGRRIIIYKNNPNIKDENILYSNDLEAIKEYDSIVNLIGVQNE